MKITKIAYWSFTLIITLLSILSFFEVFSSNNYKKEKISESYSPELAKINTMNKLDELFSKRLSNGDTLIAVNFLDSVIRERFYHSYSEFTMNDNWIAYLCGYIWRDIRFIVTPERVIKYPMAACSQQGMIFQSVLKNHQIKFRTVAFEPVKEKFSGHYTVEVFFNNKWHFYDTNLEPIIIQHDRPDIQSIIKDSLYKEMYSKSFNKHLQGNFREGKISEINENILPGQRMILFQKITYFLSKYLFLLLIFTGLISRYFNQKTNA